MIPLRDRNPSRTVPVVIYAIIAACVAVFLYSWRIPSEQAQLRFFTTYGAVPSTILRGPWPDAWIGVFTAMFLHGSWLHLGGNMLYLWVFGDNVEDAMGHGRFVVFYLLAGVVATLAHTATHPTSTVPLIGASGAIAGVLGAYLVLYPRARILSLVFIWIFIRFVELPAALVLVVWFGLQLLEGVYTFGASDVATVAWWAHIGGFLAGAALAPLFVRRE